MEVVAIIFGAITIWVVAPHYFRSRRAQLSSEERERLRFLEAENKKNDERLRSLETIVCDVDMELNSKLNRLATQQLRMPPIAVDAKVRTAPPAPDAKEHAPTELAPQTLSPGMRLSDRFEIKRHLGSGGMGDVFEAHDDVLNERVAVKVLSGLSVLDPEALQRFRREATAARRITHPNVVRLHDIGEDRGQSFISMEYVKGKSLGERIAAQGQLSFQEAADLCRQVCAALEAAHQVEVVHRDLKPDNILVDDSGRYRVIDFGVAKLPYLEGMTATGVIVGTPEYMAPEQIRGRPVDARSDLYALGAILYHALTGSPPYSGDSAIAVGFAHCNDPIPALRARRQDASDAWQTFITQALATEPAERFGSASAMATAVP